MHNQEFIEEMKAKLEEEKGRLVSELHKEAHVADGEIQANYPDYGRNEEDNATEMEDYQANLATTTAIKERLEEIEVALQRMESNTYGVTEDGQDIPENRLRANPAATTLVI
jgi:RNA polymerase-binding transcription factor DksA